MSVTNRISIFMKRNVQKEKLWGNMLQMGGNI